MSAYGEGPSFARQLRIRRARIERYRILQREKIKINPTGGSTQRESSIDELYTKNLHPSSRALITGAVHTFTASPEPVKQIIPEDVIATPVQTPPKDVLSEKLKQLEIFTQDNCLKLNILEEKRSHMHIRENTFQSVQDQLQKQYQTLYDQINELHEKISELNEINQTVWFYGECITDKQKLYETKEFSNPTGEYIEQGETVLLFHPMHTDEDQNIWTRVRRVFENGSIQDYFTPFYISETSTQLFSNFTFSNVFCTSS
jgi:hypothetical protein